MGEITKKVQERRLKWYGHVIRREEHYVGSRAMEMYGQATVYADVGHPVIDMLLHSL